MKTNIGMQNTFWPAIVKLTLKRLHKIDRKYTAATIRMCYLKNKWVLCNKRQKQRGFRIVLPVVSRLDANVQATSNILCRLNIVNFVWWSRHPMKLASNEIHSQCTVCCVCILNIDSEGININWLIRIRTPFTTDRDLWLSRKSIRPVSERSLVWIPAGLLVTFSVRYFLTLLFLSFQKKKKKKKNSQTVHGILNILTCLLWSSITPCRQKGRL